MLLLIASGPAGGCRGPETFTGNLDPALGGSTGGAGGTGAAGTDAGAGVGTGGSAGDVAIGNPDATEDSAASPAGDAGPADSAQADAAVVFDPNLVGYWKFDEGVGTILHDSSSRRYDASVFKTISWAAGAANLPKLKFPDATAITLGGGYAIATAGEILPSLSHTQTISVWINLKSTMGPDQTMVSLYNGQAGQSLALGLHASQISAWASGPRPLVAVAPPGTASWHHLAYTYDGTSHILYIDGAQAGTPQIMAPDSAPITQVLIGAFGAGGSAYQGMLDDLRVYAVALTAAQVARLASGEPSAGAP